MNQQHGVQERDNSSALLVYLRTLAIDAHAVQQY
jgi:hypothetical protein